MCDNKKMNEENLRSETKCDAEGENADLLPKMGQRWKGKGKDGGLNLTPNRGKRGSQERKNHASSGLPRGMKRGCRGRKTRWHCEGEDSKKSGSARLLTEKLDKPEVPKKENVNPQTGRGGILSSNRGKSAGC